MADNSWGTEAPLRTEQTTTLTPGQSPFDGRYLIERLLDCGGSADIYVVSHRYTQRRFALKIPRPNQPPAVHERLRREVPLLAEVRHPNIVDLHDAGESPQGPYLVLELVEGRTLEALLTGRRELPVDFVLSVLSQVAEAVVACHRQGIAHRDIKPANILVTPTGVAKLIDFNVAVRDGSTTQARMTHVGCFVGTPEYLPLEVLSGAPISSYAVDVYSFGATFYELLCGSLPHEGCTLTQRSEAPPSIASRRADLDPELASLVDRCVSTDPADRPTSMTDIAAVLMAMRRGERASLPRKAPTGRELRRYARAPYLSAARVGRADGSRLDGRVEEISGGGVQISSKIALEVGENVIVRFTLPSGDIAATRMNIRWSRAGREGFLSGGEFSEITDAARTVIVLYVEGREAAQ
ncbi:MAG: serine/threonine-protein kinase [Deltaproteobacteria bacterium]|nr:serine/threonine-protein kinase [Deltaproteobacteria bacterium]